MLALALAGGGALLHGLQARLHHETGMPIVIAPDPLHAVAIGSGQSLEELYAGLSRGNTIAKARAVSAGTNPGDRVHPEVVEVMEEAGMDLRSAQPQRLTDALAQHAQLLVTMGCGDACPYVPGLQRADWPLEDPKGKPLERVREIRDDVRGRVTQLLLDRGWDRL